MFDEFLKAAVNFLPFPVILAIVIAALGLANIGLQQRWKYNAYAQFRFQLIMVSRNMSAPA